MTEVVWKNPTPAGRLQRVVIELQARPGKWALVGEYAPTSAKSTGTRLRRLGCETTCRGRELYARWPKTPSARTAPDSTVMS